MTLRPEIMPISPLLLKTYREDDTSDDNLRNFEVELAHSSLDGGAQAGATEGGDVSARAARAFGAWPLYANKSWDPTKAPWFPGALA